VFHFSPQSPFQKRLQFIIHGLHHDDPNDPTRLVMAPVAALILAVIFYWGFRAMFGAVYVQPFFGAFIVGYLAYDYTHYYVHHFTPRTPWGKAVKRHHMAHHFAEHDARWGVSSPLWDHVFGTLPRKRSARPANTAT
jgi:sterol desaturase/sphingolipid hydroxylase (fatty acid hydroxylase superfamily)